MSHDHTDPRRWGDDQIETLTTATPTLAGRGVPTGGSGAADEAEPSKRVRVHGAAAEVGYKSGLVGGHH
jgi:hypothetical protein